MWPTKVDQRTVIFFQIWEPMSPLAFRAPWTVRMQEQTFGMEQSQLFIKMGRKGKLRGRREPIPQLLQPVLDRAMGMEAEAVVEWSTSTKFPGSLQLRQPKFDTQRLPSLLNLVLYPFCPTGPLLLVLDPALLYLRYLTNKGEIKGKRSSK